MDFRGLGGKRGNNDDGPALGVAGRPRSQSLPALPAFVTTYEILRSQDYVLVTFSAPTGEVKDGQMQTQEIQKLAFTYPRFVEFAASIAQMASMVQAPPMPARREAPPSQREPRAIDGQDDDGARRTEPPGPRVVRH